MRKRWLTPKIAKKINVILHFIMHISNSRLLFLNTFFLSLTAYAYARCGMSSRDVVKLVNYCIEDAKKTVRARQRRQQEQKDATAQ